MQVNSLPQARADRSVVHSSFGFSAIVFGLLILVLLSAGAAVSFGQVDIPVSQSYRILLHHMTGISIGNTEELTKGSFVDIIWKIRFPRVILAMFVGAGLTLCGTIMQAAVQNPLADPYILGISSGASLGATFAILVGFGTMGLLGQTGVAFWAFAGAVGASLLVLVLAGAGGKMTSVKLVLAGMVINALCTAFANFIVYFANNAEGIKTVTFWTMGSLAAASWDKLPLIAVAVTLALLFFLLQSRVLNTMLLGDEAAVTLGINLSAYRRAYMILTALITGVMVASCGMIGFVGLIIPHLVRGVVGSDHRRLVPVAALSGAFFLIWTDVIARTIIPNVELPIGIITALIGAPMFMYMLIKKGYAFGGKS
ncbi:iron ABC transporter permease [Paenibacillus sp. NFR01]|uniref:FecCD family ABC transporter permease n=1 Tax=Paenibacillus sp. NFR01 TaxID=1566279 RepID=UPI0008C9ECDB|nr:iron ABC transporter permease [Paenibacillus sp. NFR01]SET67131.1 iron complex transport system permease protein [Paenibacillus sp. NFR01]